MKKTKTCLLVLMTTLLTISTHAQKVAIAGGFNLSNVRSDLDDNNAFGGHTRSTPGWHAGMLVDIPVKNNFSIEAGAFFTTKGYRQRENYDIYGTRYKYNFRLMTINFEVPITAKYTWKMKKLDVFALAGPAIGCGIYGTTKYRLDTGGDVEKSTEAVKWGTDDDSFLKRFDLGMKVGGGVRFNNVLAGISYTYGLLDISSVSSYIHNRSFSLTVGYCFGGKE